mgnify:CR=1 FL=1
MLLAGFVLHVNKSYELLCAPHSRNSNPHSHFAQSAACSLGFVSLKKVVLPRMKNDIVDVMNACIDGRLDEIDLQFEDNAAVCVVLASDGYPLQYEKGKVITGFENFEGKDGYYVFHAGTKFDADGNIVTNGGRVLGVTAKGKDLKEARQNAYAATEWISFENKYMRHDIGKAIDEA